MIDEAATREAVQFFVRACVGLAKIDPPARILDFGCGRGEVVRMLRESGYDAFGCDPEADWVPGTPNLLTMSMSPYRLPFPDGSFDVVVSNTVLEHVLNKEESLREIARVLKPGGYAMHLFPGRWYLPREPHLFVPLSNFWSPSPPRWWLALWAALGVRNGAQEGLKWREVLQQNEDYSSQHLFYWSTSEYARAASASFSEVRWPMDFYIAHATGGAARMARRLPFRSLSGALLRETRMAFMVTRKG
jgi:SAM-dependent methyltransferase